MSLFKRKTAADDVAQCPACGERVPEGAVKCAMCGHAFETEREGQHTGDDRSLDHS